MNHRRLSNSKESKTLVVLLTLGLIFMVIQRCLAASASQDPDSRPRRSTQSAIAKPSPTPISSKSTASVSAGNQQTSASRPLPTPTPVPKPTPAGQVVPVLGEPPPPPALKPKPSPTPEGGEEIDPETVVRVNTELVTLNVRVIDRNNRPINNVKENEFRVFEDGQPQPIEFFAKEEVPIN